MAEGPVFAPIHRKPKEDWMRLTLTAATIVVSMALSSTSQAQAPPAQTPASQEGTTRPDTSSSQQSDAATFINQMTVAGMAEVQLGNIAVERAASGDVKSFGEMMAKEHRQANQDLSQVAAVLNLKPTTELDRKHLELIDRLSRLRGAEFDREFINAMVKGHEEVAGQLEARAAAATHTTGTDRPNMPPAATPPSGNPTDPPRNPAVTPGAAPRTPTLSNGEIPSAGKAANAPHERALMEWAQRTLPAVQKHLARARELQQKLAK
jgi:putative membrane protein